MPTDRVDPLFVSCEGSGAEPHGYFGSYICPMCGASFNRSDPLPKHRRPDILAMIDRGDYDE